MSEKIVGYVRVSTRKQGKSGLGLEAQRAAVEQFAKGTGSVIIAWYADVESGTKSDRPELAKAVSHAASSKAKLVIAKLDRLARDVHFTSKLMKGGVDFVCCDNQHATSLRSTSLPPSRNMKPI